MSDMTHYAPYVARLAMSGGVLCWTMNICKTLGYIPPGYLILAVLGSVINLTRPKKGYGKAKRSLPPAAADLGSLFLTLLALWYAHKNSSNAYWSLYNEPSVIGFESAVTLFGPQLGLLAMHTFAESICVLNGIDFVGLQVFQFMAELLRVWYLGAAFCVYCHTRYHNKTADTILAATEKEYSTILLSISCALLIYSVRSVAKRYRALARLC